MVARTFTQNDIWSEEFAPTREFLANFGISPRDVGEYLEDDVLKAIHHKGWETEITPENDPPGWKAEIREWRTLTQSRAAVAHDPDRMLALLRALRIALTWPTPEEDIRAFDEQSRALLGLSAKEFFERWRSNQLSTDDPRVVHLLVMRPLGW
jgi:hypothetical protein